MHHDDVDDHGMPPQIVGQLDQDWGGASHDLSGAETAETDEDLRLVEDLDMSGRFNYDLSRSPLPQRAVVRGGPGAGARGAVGTGGAAKAGNDADEELVDLLG